MKMCGRPCSRCVSFTAPFAIHFAIHLLQVNCDIRTFKEQLVYSDIRKTRIYTHFVPSRTVKVEKSPLDY
jgi:site-specific recombinase XerD